MSETRRCPQCGSELAADAPEGLCPECLLKQAMKSQGGSELAPESGGATGSANFVPFEPQALARRFPQLEIMELLGQGGMGAVYKARQPGLDRLVALKILPGEMARDPSFAERFGREARALAKLSHANIVGVYDFGQAEGLFYFIMEFVDGVNLRQVLQAGQLQPQEALKIVPQICEALQYAHDEGIVHRDIKPENILLDRKGRVKIADFGLAKLLDRTPAAMTLTAPQQVMGTPHYMAPEQVERPLEVDHRADIYSLGVVFYEMLTGELPLGRFAPPSQKVHVDVRLDEVVLRALEKEVGRRYQHICDVKTEVEFIAKGAPPAPAGVSSPTISDELLFRRVTILTLLALGAWAALLVIIAWGEIAGAEWLRKKEMPYSWVIALLLMAWVACMVYGSWWYYLLVKKAGLPRTLQGYWQVWSTPDPRIKPAWLPGLVCFGVWITALVAVNVVYGRAGHYREGPILLVMYAGILLGPFVLMASAWWAIRRRHRPTSAVKTEAKAFPSESPKATQSDPQSLHVPIEAGTEADRQQTAGLGRGQKTTASGSQPATTDNLFTLLRRNSWSTSPGFVGEVVKPTGILLLFFVSLVIIASLISGSAGWWVIILGTLWVPFLILAFVVLWLFPRKEPTQRAVDPGKQEADTAASGKINGNRPRIAGELASASLESRVLALLPKEKIRAVKLYGEETGASVKEATDAVEAIARKHGILLLFPPVPLWKRLLTLAVLGAGVALVGWGIVHSGLSRIITWPLFLLCFVPYAVEAWRYRGTHRGRRAAGCLGFFLFFWLGVPLMYFLAVPEPILNWLYQQTGTKPGPHDVDFIHVLFIAGIIGILACLVWFLRKLRA